MNKRALILLLSAVVSTTAVHGASYWAKTIGDSGSSQALSVIPTSDAGFLVFGKSGLSGLPWVCKLSSSAAVQWQKVYGTNGAWGNLFAGAKAALETADGGFLIAGTTQVAGAGATDVLLLRISSTGGIKWAKTYGGGGYDSTGSRDCLVATPDGGCLLVGVNGSIGEYSDVWALKLDDSGTVEWQKRYTGEGDVLDAKVAAASDGGFSVLLRSKYASARASTNVYRGGLMKLSESGEILWQKFWGAAWLSVDIGTLTGTSNGGSVFTSYLQTSGSSLATGVIQMCDSSGKVRWGRSLVRAYANSVTVAPDGGFLVPGVRFGGGSPAEADACLLKLDTKGRPSWYRMYGTTGEADSAMLVRLLADDDVLVFGTTGSLSTATTYLMLKTPASGTTCDNFTAGQTLSTKPYKLSMVSGSLAAVNASIPPMSYRPKVADPKAKAQVICSE